MGYVEERLWWPIQGPNIGGKKKEESEQLRGWIELYVILNSFICYYELGNQLFFFIHTVHFKSVRLTLI